MKAFVIILLLLLVSNVTKAQTHVITNTTYNYFQGIQEFPDSVLQVFMVNRESKSWRWDFAQNAVIGSNIKAAEVFHLKDSTGEFARYPAEKVHVLSLPNDSTVLGIDQFHCDIDIASVLVFVSDRGKIRKEITIDENDGWGKIQKLGMVRPNIIGVLLEGVDYYFDLDGNRIQFPEIERIYSNVAPLGANFIGSVDKGIYLLDQNFETLEVEFASDSILNIDVSGGDALLVITSNEVLIYNDLLEFIRASQDLDSIFSAKKINDRYWIGTENGLYELDTMLGMLNYFPDSEYEEIRWLGNWRDSLLIITQYNGINHTEIGVRKLAIEQEIKLEGPDISITQISIPQDVPIVISTYCPSFPGLFFDHMLISVTNHSESIISEFNIGCDFGGPGQCISFQKTWHIDTVLLLPNETVTIFIDSFTMNCVIPGGKNFCAWTFSPNDTPDVNPANDKFCDTISILNTNPTVENRLIDPVYTDTYVSHQILPDGSTRFFWHSYNSYPEAMYADLRAGESLSQLEPKMINVPDSYYWNWSSDGFASLAFSDGSTLLMNTTYECDVAVTGALVKLNKDGGIDWFNDIADEIGECFRAGKMIFIDFDRIGIQDASSCTDQMLIIDLQGNLVGFEDASFPYEEILQTYTGFIARENSKLLILDEDFQVVHMFTLAGNISHIWPQEGNEFIIKAAEKFYLLDSLTQIKILAMGNGNYDVVWKSKNYYFAADSLTGYVYLFLEGVASWLTRMLIPPGVNPIWGTSSDDNVFVLTNYLIEVSRGLLVYTGGESNFHFRLRENIGILNIDIPDSVELYYVNNGIFGGGWYHFYDFVDVEVFNYGLDTVHNFYIQDPSPEWCFMCSEEHNIWNIDSIPIPPWESVTISLGSYQPKCQFHEPGKLCLYALGPNDNADAAYVNNRSCQPFSIIIATNNPSVQFPVTIRPNPATDLIYFENDGQAFKPLTAYIYDITGVMLYVIRVDSYPLEFAVTEMPAGIYYIKLIDHENKVDIRKLVIAH